jgi:hypothetical protein
MHMSKRKLLVLGAGGLVAIALSMFLGRPGSNTDEAHRRNLKRYGDLYFGLRDLNDWLGRDLARRVGVQALENRYAHNADAEREALVTSGYLVKVHGSVTNLESRTEEINERFRHIGDIGGNPEGLTVFDTRSNCVTVICRPKYASFYREALQK